MSQTIGGNNGNRIIRNMVFLYIRQLFLVFVSLFTSRIILQNLGVTDYGIYHTVYGCVVMFIFFQPSLSGVTQRYLNIELGKGNIEEATYVFRLHQTLYFFIVIAILVFAETVGLWFVRNKLVIPDGRMVAAIRVYQFSVLSYCLKILTVVYEASIICHEDMKIYSYIGIFEGISKLAISYVISVIPFDRLATYACLFLVLTLLTTFSYVHFCRRRYGECSYRFTWDAHKIKKTFSLIGWNTADSFVYTLNDYGINILLNMFFGPAVNAARNISYQISCTLNNVCNNFYTAVRPQIIKSYASRDLKYMFELSFRSSKYALFVLWFLCLPIMLCIDPILAVWLTHIPEYTDVFTIWGLAYSMINVLNVPIGTIALAVGHLKRYVMIGDGIFFTAFPISYIFLKAGYSPLSVFHVLFVVRIIYTAAILKIIRRYVDFPIRQYLMSVIRPALSVIAVSGCICLFLGELLPPTLAGYSILFCACILSVPCLAWTLGLDDSERKFLIRKIRSILSSDKCRM